MQPTNFWYKMISFLFVNKLPKVSILLVKIAGHNNSNMSKT